MNKETPIEQLADQLESSSRDTQWIKPDKCMLSRHRCDPCDVSVEVASICIGTGKGVINHGLRCLNCGKPMAVVGSKIDTTLEDVARTFFPQE